MNRPPGGSWPQGPNAPYGAPPTHAPQGQAYPGYAGAPPPGAPPFAGPPQHGAPPPPGAQASPIAGALEAFGKKTVYEHVGLVPEHEQVFGILRLLDQRNRGRRPLLGLGSVASLLVFGWLGLYLQTPFAWLFGIFAFIACLIALRYHPTFELRRIEMASGLLRKLDLGPYPVRVKLDLRPMQQASKSTQAGPAGPAGWSTSNFEDAWLDVEGTLTSGVGFFFQRTDCLSQSVKVEVRGRVRTTYTNRTGTFTDGVVLKFGAQEYAHTNGLGADAARSIKLPEGMSVRFLAGVPGQLTLTIQSPFKWDAGPHKTQGAIDGPTGACAVIEIASLFLGKHLKPVRDAEAMPRDPGDKQVFARLGPRLPAWLVPAALGVAAAFAFFIAARHASIYVEYSGRAEDDRAAMKKAKDPTTQKRKKADADFDDDQASTAIVRGAVAAPIGLLLMIGAGVVFLKSRKKD